MSERTPYKLDQLGSVGRGRSRHRPRDDASLYGGIYPFFQTGDVKAAEFYLHDYSQTYNEKGLAQSKLWQPGTLCITIAANIAETAILSISGCFPDSVVGFIANQELADTAFVKYYLDTIKISMQNVSRGTTQDNLSLDKLLSFDLLMPLLPTQRRIASILSAYDDLIENNTRRIAILEEMARRLYEEWFVHFRFPGHESARFVETELGLVPEGWEQGELGKFSSFISRGISPTYDDSSACYVINQKCIRDNQLNMIFARKQSKRVPKEKFVLFGDILINSTGVGTLGRIAQVYDNLSNTTVDSHVTIVRAEQKIDIDFFGLSIMNLQDHFSEQGVGSTGQTELSRSRIATTPFVSPSVTLQQQFGGCLRPIRTLCSSLLAKNTNLRAQRDLLLPKLVSGELGVSEAEEVFAEVAV